MNVLVTQLTSRNLIEVQSIFPAEILCLKSYYKTMHRILCIEYNRKIVATAKEVGVLPPEAPQWPIQVPGVVPIM